jgi:hypothetical protein
MITKCAIRKVSTHGGTSSGTWNYIKEDGSITRHVSDAKSFDNTSQAREFLATQGPGHYIIDVVYQIETPPEEVTILEEALPERNIDGIINWGDQYPSSSLELE